MWQTTLQKFSTKAFVISEKIGLNFGTWMMRKSRKICDKIVFRNGNFEKKWKLRGRWFKANINMANKYSCFFHLNHVKNENAQQITKLRWVKTVQCSKEWLQLTGPESGMAKFIEHLLDLPFSSLIEAQPEFGFHPTCYRRYIDSKRISSAKKKKTCDNKEQQSQEGEVVEKRARRMPGPVRSNPVLPAKCIICHEPEKFVQDPINRKRIRDRLCKAETTDAGT